MASRSSDFGDEPTTPHKRSLTSVAGYIHTVSPMKTGKNRSQYFRCTIQTETETAEVIGFTKAHHKQLITFQENNTAINADRIRKEVAVDGTGKYLLNDKATIKAAEVEFVSSKPTTASVPVSNIAKVPLETKVNIFGHVVKVFPIQAVTLFGRQTTKMNIILAENHSSTNAILYGDLCSTVDVGSSYTLRDVKVRVDDNNEERTRFIVTTPNTRIVPYEDDVSVDFNHLQMIEPINEDQTITGNIISVQEVYKFFQCPTCTNAITIDENLDMDHHVLTCYHCKGSTLPSICDKNGSVIFSVRDTAKTVHKLTAYLTQVSQLSTFHPLPLESDSSWSILSNKNKTIVYLLQAPQLSVTFSKGSKKVSEFSLPSATN